MFVLKISKTNFQIFIYSGGESAENGNSPDELGGRVVKTPVPLIDYIQNIMKFIEAILSNNATDDHAR